MKKNASILVLLVLFPALALGWLALRAAGQQRVILENQQTRIRQQEADDLAARVRLAVNGEFLNFKDAVNRLRTSPDADSLPDSFNRLLPQSWNFPAIGFAVTLDGQILSPETPQLDQNPRLAAFVEQNRSFLGNTLAAPVYQTSPNIKAELGKLNTWSNQDKPSAASRLPDSPLKTRQENIPPLQVTAGIIQATADQKTQSSPPPLQENSASAAQQDAALSRLSREEKYDTGGATRTQTTKDNLRIQTIRTVAPKQRLSKGGQAVPDPSQLVVEITSFGEAARTQTEGILARFVDDRLQVLFWYRPDPSSPTVYGAMIEPKSLLPALHEALTPPSPDIVAALLDDRGKPALLTTPGFSADWKRPFVATEIGEVLPHWEVAVYLARPDQIERSARVVTLTLTSLIALALGAIALGMAFVARDTRRQLDLVQKKTDFVSNVSHELKTPLTSIRMFAELLQQNRASDPQKTAHYLRIITLETERLTRLINNVLDFARLEKNQKRYHKHPVDLLPLVDRVWESQKMHLEENGFTVQWHAAPGPYPVVADEDAVAQVLVNLLSNAEKYSSDRKEVELHTWLDGALLHLSVLDRGAGVPRGEEKKIFERFYRAHDSLSSGIQGSGLGLTLALRIARDHGGDITVSARPDGGSRFTLTLPLQPQPSTP